MQLRSAFCKRCYRIGKRFGGLVPSNVSGRGNPSQEPATRLRLLHPRTHGFFEPGGLAHLFNHQTSAAPPFAVFKGWAAWDLSPGCSSVTSFPFGSRLTWSNAQTSSPSLRQRTRAL